MMTTEHAPHHHFHDLELWRCIECDGPLHEASDGASMACQRCGHIYPDRDGVLIVKETVSDNNKVAVDFYNSPLWPKFRFWEWFTFACNGGEKRSRDKVLRHLPKQANLKLLDVAIGDGVYLDWLPKDWSVVGIDVSTSQLEACRKRAGSRDLKLILGEAEDLPVQDGRFDAALSIGAFNYFNDPEKALREMVRAVKPGGTIVVSDEIPNLTDRMVFRHIGLPKVDHWIVSKMMKLGDDFTDMVERYRTLDIPAIAERVLPGCRYEKIWMGVGYVFVGKAPE
jgi:ubiquinone/menaquinone biosynthesis C-methylase UbiE